MSKPFTFVFTFSFDDDKEETHIIELLSGPGVDDPILSSSFPDLPDLPEETMDLIQQQIDDRDLEGAFGVHDWSTGSHDTRLELIGYCTYEVERPQVNQLIDIWKSILIEAGYELGQYKIEE